MEKLMTAKLTVKTVRFKLTDMCKNQTVQSAQERPKCLYVFWGLAALSQGRALTAAVASVWSDSKVPAGAEEGGHLPG